MTLVTARICQFLRERSGILATLESTWQAEMRAYPVSTFHIISRVTPAVFDAIGGT
jgi:hypothetical protein